MQVKKIMQFGKLQCPYLVNLKERSIIKHEQGVFVKDAQMDIIAHPDNQIVAGDYIQGNGAVFEVISIDEAREAKGDYYFFDFKPIWQRCTVVFTNTVKNLKEEGFIQ